MTALIVGGAQGLGAALANQLAARGTKVCIVDLVSPAAPPAGAVFVRCDLAASADLADLPNRLSAYGPFEMIVLSAGISAVGAFEGLAPEALEKVLNINCLAPITLSRALIAQGLIARRGRLVLIASLSHFTGYPGASVYAASKDALVAFAKSLRRPLRASHGIVVQVVTPGPMRTDHAERYAPKGSSGKGRADPAEIARAILRARRRLVIVPGMQTWVMATFGRLFPVTATRLMRRMLFERLT
jgi:short-subunit dehydrogenase